MRATELPLATKAVTTVKAPAAPLPLDVSFPLRALRVLQRIKPIVSIGKNVIVTRHDDVTDILKRDQDFTIAEVNSPAMDRVNGPFILGMDRSEQYEREQGILRKATRASDLDFVRATVREITDDLLDRARPSQRIDVVQELARPAAVHLVDAYFGVPGPDSDSMKRWMRAIFRETFLNVGKNTEVREAGERAGDEFHVYADALIAQRKMEIATAKKTPDDFLTRLVHMQADSKTALSDEGIRRCVGGVVVGAVDTTSKAVAQLIDQLLRRPNVLGEVTAAARSGDVDTVGRYCWEALRFNPLNTVMARHAARATTVAGGTSRERKIAAGQRVYPAVAAAMFDPLAFPQPGAFRVNRPPEKYLHFGHGMHTCFGEHINHIQIPEIVSALLRVENLRLAPGKAGTITYDGPFPDSLWVEFDATPMAVHQ